MYALVIPPIYLEQLVAIRAKTGISIRKQILEATEKHIEENGLKLNK